MAAWYEALAVEGLAGRERQGDRLQTDRKAERAVGIWQALEQRSSPSAYRPQANPIVISRRLHDQAEPYYVLKNPQKKSYLRLSESEYRLYAKMDGQISVQDLIVDHYMESGLFAHQKILHLVGQLHRQAMLAQAPVFSWTLIQTHLQRKSWSYRLGAPARWMLTQKLNLPGIDGILGWMYRIFGWLCFTRPAQWVFLAISIAGLAAFFEIIGNRAFTFMEGSLSASLWLWWLAALAPVVIHELGHGLTVKHFGREVPRGGLMLYFGLPAAFVETTDIWLEERRARLAVTWNGPYTGLIIGGAASLLILASPASPAVPLLLKMGSVAYATVFFNVNPLLKFDGYFLLVDALNVPSLREKSLAFIRKRLFNRERKGHFSRLEWVYLVFGILTMLWMGYALYLALFFWEIRLQAGLQVVLGAGYPLFARVLGFLGLAAALSLLVLLSLNLLRTAAGVLARIRQSVLFTRHNRLALVLLIAAVGAGMALPESAASWLATGLALAAALLIFDLSEAYAFSKRQFAYLCFGAALICLACGSALPDASALTWAGGSLLAAGGLLLDTRLVPLRDGLAAPLAGGLLTWPVMILLGISWDQAEFWAATLTAVVGIRTVLATFRSARTAGVLLLFAGGVLAWLPIQAPRLAALPLLILSAGGLQLWAVRMPFLQTREIQDDSVTSLVVGAAMSALVHRLIAQIYFEAGLPGVSHLGEAFNAAMQRSHLDISIWGNRFSDRELQARTAGELSNVYRLVLEILYGCLRSELGTRLTRRTILMGIDHLPWQNREVFSEMILCRMPWSWIQEKESRGEIHQLREMLRSVPLFVTLPDESLVEIAHRLVEEDYGAGETILSQGERGDKFYIVASGKVAVWQTDQAGNQELVEFLGRGHSFGEQALISDQPRNATLKTVFPTRLLSMNRAAFDALVRQYVSLNRNLNKKVRYSWLLRGMPIFDSLQSHELDWLALQLKSETYAAGDVVFQEGDAGDRFFVIEAGRLTVTRRLNGESVLLSERSSGEYLGEISLLQDQPRSATLTALTDARLLSLAGSQFRELLAGYSRLAEAVSKTGSRRQKFIEKTIAKVESR